jgi:hypothetical protein
MTGMKRLALIALLTAGLGAPLAQAQIVKPTLYPAPCTGGPCLNTVSGSTVHKNAANASAQKVACPEGSTYDARKGTCHVGGANLGAITHY